jgi:hypothetical protein
VIFYHCRRRGDDAVDQVIDCGQRLGGRDPHYPHALPLELCVPALIALRPVFDVVAHAAPPDRSPGVDGEPRALAQ